MTFEDCLAINARDTIALVMLITLITLISAWDRRNVWRHVNRHVRADPEGDIHSTDRS